MTDRGLVSVGVHRSGGIRSSLNRLSFSAHRDSFITHSLQIVVVLIADNRKKLYPFCYFFLMISVDITLCLLFD